MSMCSICGGQEWHHTSGPGAGIESYCPRCNPRPVKMLPVDDGGQKSPISVANAATGPCGPTIPNGSAVQFDGPGAGPISLEMEGSKVMTAYDELPKTAEEGEIAFKKGENTAYVFDGEEWQNLGKVARQIRPGKDDKCNRRGAIAATKAKMEAE